MRDAIAALAVLHLAGCAQFVGPPQNVPGAFASTYQKFLARAEGGDPESQNAVGFMLFHGEGAPMDRRGARHWFEKAANGGSARAKRNLAALAADAAAFEPRAATAVPALPRTKAIGGGEQHFVKFCGGCHGFNGIARFEHAPSFAFGERLEKSDEILMRSLRNGHAGMPGWEDKVPLAELAQVLVAVRRMPARYDAGVDASMNDTPDRYFVFGPMEDRRQ